MADRAFKARSRAAAAVALAHVRRIIHAIHAHPAQADLLTRLEGLRASEVESIVRGLARVEQLLGAGSIAPTPLFED